MQELTPNDNTCPGRQALIRADENKVLKKDMSWSTSLGPKLNSGKGDSQQNEKYGHTDSILKVFIFVADLCHYLYLQVETRSTLLLNLKYSAPDKGRHRDRLQLPDMLPAKTRDQNQTHRCLPQNKESECVYH